MTQDAETREALHERTRFSVRLATEEDNEQLVTLTKLCPMEGRIAVCTERDPRFFTLNELQGHPYYLAVAQDHGGKIVGCASLALRNVYIDGKPTQCFYAGDLKIEPSARGTTVLRQLHDFLGARQDPWASSSRTLPSSPATGRLASSLETGSACPYTGR